MRTAIDVMLYYFHHEGLISSQIEDDGNKEEQTTLQLVVVEITKSCQLDKSLLSCQNPSSLPTCSFCHCKEVRTICGDILRK